MFVPIIETDLGIVKLHRHSPACAPGAVLNPLSPNDPYRSRTATLTSKLCILYIYSTNIGTEYFKHVIYSPFFSSSKCSLFRNSNLFGSCIIHILYTECAKIKKKIIPAPKGQSPRGGAVNLIAWQMAPNISRHRHVHTFTCQKYPLNFQKRFLPLKTHNESNKQASEGPGKG